MGFPRFKKKGRDRDRVTFTTGAIRVEADRRQVTLPRIGTIRVYENTRRLERLIAKGRARILAATVSCAGGRIVVAFRVLVARPQQPRLTSRDSSIVGVDVGVRVLATVGAPDGTILERVPNPRPLDAALKEMRHLGRERSRRTIRSRRYRQTQARLTRLYRRVADIRAHHIHNLTTRLAKTHGRIVVEGLDAAGMLRQKGLNGARARRRGLADSALADPRRQLRYKSAWYGSQLIEADRWYPSSKTCHKCGHVQDIGWSEHWTCERCSARHQRDDNASINLARYDTGQSLAPSAQSGPPTSVEPTVRPGHPGLVAVKRGREAGTRLPNNPETGC
jgi:putative transposase